VVIHHFKINWVLLRMVSENSNVQRLCGKLSFFNFRFSQFSASNCYLCLYKMVQIWPGQTVTSLHTNSRGHIWTTLYFQFNWPLFTARLAPQTLPILAVQWVYTFSSQLPNQSAVFSTHFKHSFWTLFRHVSKLLGVSYKELFWVPCFYKYIYWRSW
jgi:hypothetical protein